MNRVDERVAVSASGLWDPAQCVTVGKDDSVTRWRMDNARSKRPAMTDDDFAMRRVAQLVAEELSQK